MKRKFFLCTNEIARADQLAKHPTGHIIGELLYVFDEGPRVSALAVYERSQPCDHVPPVYPLIRLVVIGDARGIRCTICNRRKKRWEIGLDALRQLKTRFVQAML